MPLVPSEPPEPRFYASKHCQHTRRCREAIQATLLAILAGVIGIALLCFVLLPALLVVVR